ncbi:MAG: hydroxyacid dehydrogenase [Streptococcaceae bacterium]|jgi:D-3-phosphoglycerate dehydrogenase|nr:hydroxyacid dehydrogenase [Streptococcaceae bacterium]
MKQKVLLPNDIPEAGKKLLQDAGLEVIVGSGREKETMKKEGADVSAVLIGTQEFNSEIMDAMPKLKVIARNGVGFDSVDIEAATARGIQVVNTPESLSRSVAETVISEILAISKNLVQNTKALEAGDWEFKRSHLGHDLAGKTLGILGFGRIGRAVAKLAKAFEMKIIAFDPYPPVVDGIEFVSREEVLRRGDYVSVHLPAIPATEKSISTNEFALIKNSAYFINLARGSIVDEVALVRALLNNEIAGAALDVYEKEPLSLESPLLKLPNVLLTPHLASNTVEARERMAVDAARGIVEVMSSIKPKWAVNQL